jgi:hypothetical protein
MQVARSQGHQDRRMNTSNHKLNRTTNSIAGTAKMSSSSRHPTSNIKLSIEATLLLWSIRLEYYLPKHTIKTTSLTRLTIKSYTAKIIYTEITPIFPVMTNINTRVLLIPLTKEIDMSGNIALSLRLTHKLEMRILVISGKRLDTLLHHYHLNISATPF